MEAPVTLYFYLPIRGVTPLWPQAFWPPLIAFLAGRKGYHDGPYSHTLQPFLYFQGIQVNCELTESWPATGGVVVAHSDFLSALTVPRDDQTIVEIKPDRFVRCPFANFHIIQNMHDPLIQWQNEYSLRTVYIPYWPQPGLIPRNLSRKDLFQNICFLGNQSQMHPDLLNINAQLKEMGMGFTAITEPALWGNYSEVDAIIALRPNLEYDYPTKPATKLSNSWLAGVPAVLGPESAYKAIGIPGSDYLEAPSINAAVDQITLLQRDIYLRRKVVSLGMVRGAAFTRERIEDRWNKVITETVLPYHKAWIKSAALRRHHFEVRQSFAELLNSSH